MKSAMFAVLVMCSVISFGGAAIIRHAGLRGSGSVVGSGAQADLDKRAASAVQELVHGMISGDGGVQLVNIVGEASRYVDFEKAAQALAAKHSLPTELSAVLARSSSNSTVAVLRDTHSLSEESLTKARQFLNTMVEKAQKELDDKVIEAKEFEARNRGAQAQVVADIARLGTQVADQMGLGSEATTGIADMNRETDDVKKQRQDEKDAYDREYAINFADMTIKQNDLDVFDFLIKATKKVCDQQAASLIEVGRQPRLQVCSSSAGGSLRFGDAVVQAKFDKLLTKGTHDLLNNALFRVQTGRAGLLQATKGSGIQSPAQATPVADGQSEELGDVKCGPIPDCGLLYDTLSLQWGGYKDQVDELKKEMDKNDAAWLTIKTDFDAQISSLTATLGAWVQALSEATAAKNGDMHVTQQKEEEKRALDDEHKKTMQKFRDRIAYIVQQDICGPIVIRNEVMKESTECQPKDIDDCDVTPWTPAACSVACDDRCPEMLGCGGTQALTRDIVVPPNTCGIKCPVLTLMRKCSQFKCPVDCLMSQWSGWSKCSKDCEGGVQERTRSILVKPKTGGKGCSAVSDGRPCNTGSCDRDCSMEDWTSWSPCSMACGGGDQQRLRKVDIPIRGSGTCPTPTSNHRLQNQACNTLACVGDEVCVAKQDLVILVDGSGSVHSDGFKLIRNFTGELLKRYKTKGFGEETMQVGIVLFGNGAIEDDGTISKAKVVSELIGDLGTVEQAAKAMERQKGFTNMAQAYALAEKLLQQKSRKDAQSAVMMISDGKPSFLFETREKNKALKEKGITLFNVGIAEFPGSDEWKLMEEFASKPADTNTVRVPGLDALQDGGGPFVEEALTKFCPASLSPSRNAEVAEAQGFMLVRKGGYCGRLGECPGNQSHPIVDANTCREIAAQKGATSFSLGHGLRAGVCCVEPIEFSCDIYKRWEENMEDPECSWASAEFQSNSLFNWFAIEPNCEN